MSGSDPYRLVVEHLSVPLVVARASAGTIRYVNPAAEATLAHGAGLSVTVRLGEVERVEHERGRSLGVSVYFGQRKGSASTSAHP